MDTYPHKEWHNPYNHSILLSLCYYCLSPLRPGLSVFCVYFLGRNGLSKDGLRGGGVVKICHPNSCQHRVSANRPMEGVANSGCKASHNPWRGVHGAS
mmetsp:Transcript_9188/g.26320  ORF Transcript_9188/g.26320 Transcript_9188/m.26320 type:complete len:98 (-) Transcript_9188:853-1146(-)